MLPIHALFPAFRVALVATLAAAGAVVAPVPNSSAVAAPPAGFQVTNVFTGLDHPTTFQFATDGRVFVAEKSGIIKVFDGLADPSPDVFADLRTNVHNYWDRGLLGMALDPGFPTRPYVYVLYSFDAPIGGTAPRWGTAGATTDGCPSPPGPNTDGCVISSRLSRLTASGNAMTGPEVVLINDWCQQFPSHSAGTLAFGPDGALYASHGEGAAFHTQDWGQLGGSPGSPTPRNPCGDPPGGVGGAQAPPSAEGGSLRAQDLRTPSDPATLDGSVIRVNPGTAAAAAGNPGSGASDPNVARIVAHGMRNPFRFTFRPGTSEIWLGDVGDTRWEEVNRLATPPTAVTNFGWPCYEGAVRHIHWDFNDLAICETLYGQANAVKMPYLAYPHGGVIAPGDTCPVDGGSVTGLAFYGSGNYPASYNGALFVGDYTRKCIWVVPAGSNGLPDPSLATTFLSGAGGPIEIRTGAGGDVFYLDFDTGALKRIRYFSANRPPVAVIGSDRTSGGAPLAVHFDGRDSSDADNDALRYAWDLDGDGALDDATTATADFTYTQAGTYIVKLRVTDPSAASDTATLTITVGNTPPVPTISTPSATLRWSVADTISFSGSAQDGEQGALPASALTWKLVIHHCANANSCHVHDIQDFAGVASGSVAAPDHEYPSYLELRLTATDGGGLTASTSVRLDPRTVDVTAQSVPAGLSLAAGSQTGPAPFTSTVIANSTLGLSAPQSQTVAGHRYAFVSWSDGGAATHDVHPTTTRTYTATYRDTGITAPLAADAFTRTRASGWGSADVGGAWALSTTAASFGVNGSAGTMQLGAGQTRAAFLGVTARDVDLSFGVAADKAPTGGGLYAYGVARRVDASTEYRMKVRLRADGSVWVQAGRTSGATETPLGVETRVAGLTLAPGSRLNVRARVTGASPTTISIRAWAQGGPEPSGWAYQVTDGTAALQVAGGLGLRTYVSSNVTNAPIAFSFDDFVAQDPSGSPPPPPPSTLASDAFSRSVANGWGTPDAGGPYGLVGAAAGFAVGSGTGTMQLSAGQTRAATLAVNARDVDLTVSVTTDRMATGSGSYAYAIARRADASTEYRAVLKLSPNGSLQLVCAAVTGGTERSIGAAVQVAGAGTYAAGQRWRIRFVVSGASPTTLRARAWRDGTPEPTAWNLQLTDSSAGLQAAGGAGLRAYLSGGSTGGAVLFSFDDLEIRPAS